MRVPPSASEKAGDRSTKSSDALLYSLPNPQMENIRKREKKKAGSARPSFLIKISIRGI
jgi:hypothetical protein